MILDGARPFYPCYGGLSSEHVCVWTGSSIQLANNNGLFVPEQVSLTGAQVLVRIRILVRSVVVASEYVVSASAA
jgi:hypothetical protein